MSEPKPFASLSSGLLARKGAARPAMRPQGFGQIGGNLEDLGWNDMGFEAPKPVEAPRDADHDAFGEEIAEHPALHGHAGLTPVNSPVHTQQAEIADRLNDAEDDSLKDGHSDRNLFSKRVSLRNPVIHRGWHEHGRAHDRRQFPRKSITLLFPFDG